jgi:hypothetical protein
MTDEWISPTDSERRELERQIMINIYPQIEILDGDDDRLKLVKQLLIAVEECRRMTTEANRRFAILHTGKKTHNHYPEVMDIIATCIACKITGEDIKDFSPLSVGGELIAAFAKLARVLVLSNNLESEVDDDASDDYGWEFAKSIIEREEEAV